MLEWAVSFFSIAKPGPHACAPSLMSPHRYAPLPPAAAERVRFAARPQPHAEQSAVAATPLARALPPPSLLGAGLVARLGLAGGVLALLWSAIWWALH